jgi:hypothetical protein
VISSTTPGYLFPYVLGGTFAIAAALLLGLRQALKNSGLPPGTGRRVFRDCAILLAVWLFAAVLSSWLGFYQGAPGKTPTVPIGLLLPIAVIGALYWRSPSLRTAVNAVPQKWLVGVQLYRTLGLIFLVLYAFGRAPGVFAWPAGVGDILVGLLAPVIGAAYARNPRRAVPWLRAWNLLGIADLVVALTTGFLSSPSPLQLFALDTPNELITRFPLVLIPVFLVPLSILLHLASLQKLSRSDAPLVNSQLNFAAH